MSATLTNKADRLENILNPDYEKKQRINNFFEILQEIMIETQSEFKTPDKAGVFYCFFVLVEIK